MARLTGPLFSLAASGTIADTLTFANWKGIPYVRTRVIPANPNTTAQQETRGVFATLNEMWKRMPTWARKPWQYFVRGKPLTARNRFLQVNLPLLINDADLSDIMLGDNTGQAVKGDIKALTDNADGTFGMLVTQPTAPVGYTLTEPYGFAVLTGDPSPVLIRTMYELHMLGAGPSGGFDVPENGVYEVGYVQFFTRDADDRPFASIADMSRVTVTGN